MTGRQGRSNPSTKIEQVVGISSLTLMVYYTAAKCWKYAIAGKDGSYESERIYYTAEAAEREGRRQVEVLLG